MKRSTIIFLVILFQLIASDVFPQDSLYYITSFHGSSNADALDRTFGLGDINGDGLSDFIITYRKHTELYFGSRNLNELKPAYVFRCWKSAPIGDVNGDGITDLMTVEKDTADPYYPHTSDLFKIYFGGKTVDTVPKFTFKFPYYFKMFYTIGENIGDINGDGYGDFIIGSPYNWDDGIGFVYVFSGGKTLASKPILKFRCPEDSLLHEDILFGRQIIGIGDNNKDGFDDFLVSASNVSMQIARVYLYNGGNQLSDKPAKILTDPVDETGVGFGRDLRNAGDLNKDGNNDFIITGGADNAYIYLSLDSIVAVNTRRYGFGGYIGVGTGGDINGDGYNDFLVSNTNHLNSQGVMVGMANVFYGGNTIDTVENASMEGTGKWFEYGKFMCIPGDINGDGYAEVFVHEPSWPDYSNSNSTGKATLYSYKKLTNAVEEKSFSPEDFCLLQNYPNPFNPTTTISYAMPYSGHVELKIYDMLGKEVMNVFSGEMPSGIHKAFINAGSLPSGIYVCRINILSEKVSFEKSIKMTLLK